MMNLFENSDWQWLFKNAIHWEKIIPLYFKNEDLQADGFKNHQDLIQSYSEILALTCQWSDDKILPRATILDQEGAGTVKEGRTFPHPELLKSYQEATEMGVLGLSLPKDFGGTGAPVILHMIVLSQVSRSCVGQGTQLAFFTSLAEMIYRFCPNELQEKYIPLMIAGKISGSMCITEPQCGSDLSMIRTKASKQNDGTFLINGSKIFITNGGGGLHFTLARIEGSPDGLEGLSLFFIDQNTQHPSGNNYQVVKNEDKMGMHASFTCEILYENSKAVLVGEENKGFEYMLHLMNEARIAVGMQSLGMIEACYFYAKNYADQRIQFGKPISELPLLKRLLQDFEAEYLAIKALMIDSISYFDIYAKLSLKKHKTNDLSQQEKKLYEEAKLWTRKRTPLIKYYTSEALSSLSVKCIQVLGGYGYMKDYQAERFHRDSFGPLLYEGTSQIQALMCLKDLVKYAMKNPKKFFQSLFPIDTFEKEMTLKNFHGVQRKFKRNMVKLFIKSLKPTHGSVWAMQNWTKSENVERLMVHAETLCQGLSYIETLRVLWKHSEQDTSRLEIYQRYQLLVTPRLESIYTDWDLRS